MYFLFSVLILCVHIEYKSNREVDTFFITWWLFCYGLQVKVCGAYIVNLSLFRYP